MQRLLFLLLVGFSLTFTSCIDIIEEIFLNKNGSGKYTMTIDMSAMMEASTLSLMRSMGESMAEEGEEGEEGGDTDALNEVIETDTTIYFKDIPAADRTLDRKDFYDKVKLEVTASESKEKFIMQYTLDFDKVADIDYFLKNMDKLSAAGSEENPLGGMGDMAGGGLFPSSNTATGKLFKWSKKTLTRAKSEAPEENLFAGEEMAMAKMMFVGATYKTVYHFPGKVKSASNPNAAINGKMVTIEQDLLEVMEGKADLSSTFKFKKR